MNAIANAAVQAPGAPRDIGRPLPFYICRNCWHTFSAAGAEASDNAGKKESESADTP
jgi:hypothetical protein